MAKSVFRPAEVLPSGKKFVIDAPKFAEEIQPVEEVRVPDEYLGPTADDLRREAEDFKRNWDREKQAMLASAKVEADKLVRDAETVAFESVRKKTNEAQKLKEDAEAESERIIAEAGKKAAEIELEAQGKAANVLKEATDKGYADGREAGYAVGKEETERLSERVHVILDKAMEKRSEILQDAEAQIVDLVLLISKKVIKVLSENQKNVVVSNVIQALRKLKTRGDVIIRVNLADLQLTASHAKDFTQMVENAKSITVVEDSTVDRGGCVIETDFGQIDARISSQLHELEERILESAPIKARSKEGIKES